MIRVPVRNEAVAVSDADSAAGNKAREACAGLRFKANILTRREVRALLRMKAMLLGSANDA